jgi:predicted transcriptional regulator
MKLTQKEQLLYDSVCRGMDQPGCGWLHELTMCGWSNRTTAGVLSSLIKKGLVHSHQEDDAYWVTLVNQAPTDAELQLKEALQSLSSNLNSVLP